MTLKEKVLKEFKKECYGKNCDTDQLYEFIRDGFLLTVIDTTLNEVEKRIKKERQTIYSDNWMESQDDDIYDLIYKIIKGMR